MEKNIGIYFIMKGLKIFNNTLFEGLYLLIELQP